MMQHPPTFSKDAFDCPHCDTFAHQTWYTARAERMSNRPSELPDIMGAELGKIGSGPLEIGPIHTSRFWGFHLSECQKCKTAALWVEDKLMYPLTNTAPAPNPDLPENVLADYREAAQIFNLSPRGAAALLRLAVEKLCHELTESDNPLNKCIETLVSDGLDQRVQQALDTVRVIGNESVHPGLLVVEDNQEIVHSLFELVNIIADEMITKPKQVSSMYSKLPQSARDAIDRRDSE